MSKKEKLIKEIDILREKRKDWFNVLFALASAVVILVYSVLSGEKPLFILILGFVGFAGVLGLAFYYKRIETTIEEKLEQPEKEK